MKDLRDLKKIAPVQSARKLATAFGASFSNRSITCENQRDFFRRIPLARTRRSSLSPRSRVFSFGERSEPNQSLGGTGFGMGPAARRGWTLASSRAAPQRSPQDPPRTPAQVRQCGGGGGQALLHATSRGILGCWTRGSIWHGGAVILGEKELGAATSARVSRPASSRSSGVTPCSPYAAPLFARNLHKPESL